MRSASSADHKAEGGVLHRQGRDRALVDDRRRHDATGAPFELLVDAKLLELLRERRIRPRGYPQLRIELVALALRLDLLAYGKDLLPRSGKPLVDLVCRGLEGLPLLAAGPVHVGLGHHVGYRCRVLRRARERANRDDVRTADGFHLDVLGKLIRGHAEVEPAYRLLGERSQLHELDLRLK
jgi:hypothetical protein